MDELSGGLGAAFMSKDTGITLDDARSPVFNSSHLSSLRNRPSSRYENRPTMATTLPAYDGRSRITSQTRTTCTGASAATRAEFQKNAAARTQLKSVGLKTPSGPRACPVLGARARSER